jgi:hypothetical protein
MNGAADDERVVQAVAARLPSGTKVMVETAADPADGMTSVGRHDLDLGEALDSVGEIGSLVLDTLKKAMPSKATVQLKVGFAVEAGKLTALWVGGKGEAALTVTLEWSGRPENKGTEGDGEAGDADEGGDD